MKLTLILLLILACNKPQPAVGAEQEAEAPCHENIKIIDTGSTLRFISNCDLENPTIWVKALDGKNGKDGIGIKGDRGVAGISGSRGPKGPKGDSGDGSEQFVTVCLHGLTDHIDKTWSISVSELVSKRWGNTSKWDYAGSCYNEGQCNCDQCLDFIGNDLHLSPIWSHGDSH